MTLLNPHILLNRMVVISNAGDTAYDETFHPRTNIIRGRNSSGKSTVANLIFFGLGGDYVHWTEAALECREVYAEVQINDATLTLRRHISTAHLQPMSIYWGSFEDASEAGFEGWMHLPYSQSEKKESFTNILFNALGFPEIRDDNENKITMHQILRLMYIDQESPSQSLFRWEKFDPPLIRQAVSELLLGVYDDALYNDRVNLRDSEKTYAQKKAELDAVRRIITASGKTADVDRIRKEITHAHEELTKTQTEISATREKASVVLRATSPIKFQLLGGQYSVTKAELGDISTQIKKAEFDILDSEQFIQSLEEKVAALSDSILTKTLLGEMPVAFCPQCLRPLETKDTEDNCCALCKQVFEDDFAKTYGNRLKQELSLQIKESKQLLDEKKQRLTDLIATHNTLVEKFRALQRDLDNEEKELKPTRDELLDSLHEKKGAIENKIGFLNQQIVALESLDLLRSELQELAKKIEGLRQSVQRRIETQARNLQTAMAKIEEITLYLLLQDFDLQNEFKVAQLVEVDFAKDVFSLDGKNNFSASSNVYLKNCVRYAVFFASLDLPFFRYPRFILCDNMEDKGMEQERSQNFQRTITELSTKSSVEHQIIFTTSKIAPDLNNTPLCVGDEYTPLHKTLRLT